METKLSIIILTKNEEKNITDCLESLSFCDEIVVVDDNSEDRTVKIIENLKNDKIKVYKHALDNDFSRQRNFALSKTNGDWVLFIDADERVASKLKNEVIHLISTSDRRKKLNGYFIKRVDFMWGRPLRHGETANVRLLRLAKINLGKWEGKVHERWNIKGKVGELKNPLHHYPHKNITEFLTKINYYTYLRAKELHEKRVKVQWWDIILYPKMKFFINYFLKRGFIDGIHGLVHALTMSFHSFLVRSKLWLLWNK